MSGNDYIDSALGGCDTESTHMPQGQQQKHAMPSQVCPPKSVAAHSSSDQEEVCDGFPAQSINNNIKPAVPHEPISQQIKEKRTSPLLGTMKPETVSQQQIDQKLFELASNRNQLMAKDHLNTTNFHLLAQRTNNLRIIQRALATLAGNTKDIMQQNNYGHTPLLMSVLATNLNFTVSLLNAGVRYDQFDWKGRTFLHYLAERGLDNFTRDVFKHHTFNYEATRRLLNTYDFDGMTPLTLAVKEGNTAAFQHFVQFGDELLGQREKKRGNTLLHLAAEQDNTYVIERLIHRGLDVNSQTMDEATPLHLAVSAGHLNATRVLLQARADPNIFLRENSIFGLIPSRVEEEMRALFLELIPSANYQELLQYSEFSEYEDDDDDAMSDY